MKLIGAAFMVVSVFVGMTLASLMLYLFAKWMMLVAATLGV